jgi:hypothetical protein
MSEPESQRNSSFEAVNFVNSTAAVHVNLASCNLHNETPVSVVVLESQAENREVIDCATFSNAIEASENCLAQLAPSHRLELFTLIQALRSANSNLLKRVTQLEQSLTECLKALHSSKKYSRVAKSKLTQQTQELAASQEKVKCLAAEMEASHQTAQHQQTLIENLTAQLQSSQERFAQLEWEHYLTQASYTEQSDQLAQTENTCRELRTRLNRQQHYTLQLKVALEKCLETSSGSSYQSEVDIDSISSHTKSEQGRSVQPQSFFSKAESIPPWSAQPEFLTNELERPWAESSHLPDVQTKIYHQSCIVDWSDEDLSTPATAESIPALEIDELIPLEQAVGVETVYQQSSEEVSNKTGQTLEAQHDAVIDVGDRSSLLPPVELIETTENITESEEAEWQDLQDLLAMVEAGEKPVIASPEVTTVSASAQLDEPLTESNLAVHHLLDPGSESVSPDETTQIQLTSPQQHTSSFTANSNWPSPLIHPSHPPKRRKSLAAIELPTFTQARVRNNIVSG